MKYRLICMAFDGEYVTERPVFDTISEAWDYSNDLGSKWFFYPFHFVTNETGTTIKDTGYFLEHLIGRRTKTVAAIFAAHSLLPESQGLDPEGFAITI